MSQFQESSYKAHQDGRKFEGKAVDSVMNKQSVDYWRHERMYNTLLTLLKNYPNAKWLTVGDGNFGKDANFILSHGGDALATDLNNPSFEKALEVGLLKSINWRMLKDSVSRMMNLIFPCAKKHIIIFQDLILHCMKC